MIRFCLVMTALVTCLTCHLQAQGGNASLHGIVIALKGGAVVNARVVAEGAAGEATTNERGGYRLTGIAAGLHKVGITAPGYDAFEIQINVAATGETEADAVMMAIPPPPQPAIQTPEASEPGAAAPVVAAVPTAAQTVVAAQNIGVKPERGRSALYGLTTDQTGAVIAGGTATVAFPGGKANTVTANGQGLYVLNGLAPGQYHLKVMAAGFAPFETDITLASDQALQLDATLLPPSSVTNVDVTATTGAEVKTDTAQIEGTITEKEVLKTGLNGRNFTQLIALAPGVSNQTGQDEAMVGLKGSVKYSVNGGRVEYNNFDVDGGDVLNAGLNGAESTLMVYPSLDAISEVKVLTSNYGAMYGRTASGTVLVTTKSGLPKYHGGLYDFVRNEFFNARNYFDLTKKAPLYRRQDFGGTLGGPIYKDKTFFFWSEEFRLEKTPQEFSQAVPSAAERGIGVTNCSSVSLLSSPCADFSDVCPLPSTTQVTIDRALYPDCPAVKSGPTAYASNLVPINATTQAFLATGMVPLPNSTGGCNSSLANTINFATQQPNVPCYNAVISPSTYWREELFRVDHNFTQNLRLSFRYIHDTWNTTVLTPQWGYIVNSFPTVQNKLNGPGTSMVARFDSNSSTLLNDLVVSYVDAHINITDISGPGANLAPIPSCGSSNPTGCMNYLFDNGAGGKPPGLIFSGTNAQYGGSGFQVDPSYAPWEHTNPTYGLGDNVTKQIGGLTTGHQLQFGIQVTDAQRRENNAAIGSATGDLQGLLSFSNQNSFSTGNAFADFLVTGSPSGFGSGGIKSYQQDSAQLKYYNNYWVAEPYVQDDWHMSRRLTLNLGLRLSLFQNFHEKNLNAYNWEAGAFQTSNTTGITIAGPGSGAVGYLAYTGSSQKPVPFTWNGGSLPAVLTNGLVQCGKNGIPASCASSHTFNPAPRIGFAWDPKGDGKSSIRGGYGVFFEHGTPKEANTGSLEGGAPLVLTMTQPFPGSFGAIGLGCNNAQTCSSNVPVAFPFDVTSIPTKTVWPYVQQWSLSLQQQLPKDMVATVAYVGSKGTHLTALLQINQLPVPPTGADTGIFPDGNPFNAHQPITTSECNISAGAPYIINQIAVTSAQPAYKNLAAACYGVDGNFGPNLQNSPNLYRPYFGFQRILSLQDIGDSQYHALQATLRRTKGPFTLGGSYTYSHSLDDASDRSDASFVNSANYLPGQYIRANWASSSFDERHLLNLNYIYDVPKVSRNFQQSVIRSSDTGAEAGAPGGVSKFLGILLDSWQLSGVTVFQSGTPFSIINSGSNTGISVLDNAGVANGSGAGSYPDVVGGLRTALPAGVSKFNPQSFGPLLYNPSAFAAPQGLTFGNAGRNFVNNPHRINFDASALKNFKLAEGHNLEFRLEAFNVFNHTQFRIFNPNIGNAANNTISCYGGGLNGAPYTAAGGLTILPGSSNQQPENVDCTTGSAFLRPIDAHRPRTIQLGLKYSF